MLMVCQGFHHNPWLTPRAVTILGPEFSITTRLLWVVPLPIMRLVGSCRWNGNLIPESATSKKALNFRESIVVDVGWC